MNKLFTYSKNAAFGVIFLMIIQIAFVLIKCDFSPQIQKIAHIIYDTLWIILFALIIKYSVKNSPLVTPSIIIGTAFFLGIVNSIIPIPSNYHIIRSVLILGAIAATVIGFLWFSKYFSKGSPQKKASLIYPIASLIIFIPVYIPVPVREIVGSIFTYGAAFFFMYSLSKFNK